MKELKKIVWSMAAFCLVLGAISLASAQNASQSPATPGATQAPSAQPEQAPGQMPERQTPGQQSDQSSQPSGQAAPSTPQNGQPAQQAPGAQTPAAQAGSTQQVQTFTGTIVKSGDKYVLQDSTTGTAYDIDHQDVVGQHVGRRVRVTGTLGPDGKTIHLQPATH